jgi:hypothetical protein
MGGQQLRISLRAASILAAGLLSSSIAVAASGFSQRLELQGYAFEVSVQAQGSTRQLTIVPQGLSEQRGPTVVNIEGEVTGAEIADLDANGFPELYVYVSTSERGRYGRLVGYAVNKGKSITEIYLPPVSENAKLRWGYRGQDEFAVVESTFVQRFPIFRNGYSSPSGKTRQLQYKLKQGEAGWILRLDKVLEY